MTQIPVNEKKEELKRELFIKKIELSVKIQEKHWEEAQELALELIELKQSLDPAFRISELSDLQDALKGLNALVNHMYNRNAEHYLEVLEEQRKLVSYELKEKYGLETKYFLNEKERDTLIGLKSKLRTLEATKKHRDEEGKPSPNTERQMLEVKDKISQLELKDETRNG